MWDVCGLPKQQIRFTITEDMEIVLISVMSIDLFKENEYEGEINNKLGLKID